MITVVTIGFILVKLDTEPIIIPRDGSNYSYRWWRNWSSHRYIVAIKANDDDSDAAAAADDNDGDDGDDDDDENDDEPPSATEYAWCTVRIMSAIYGHMLHFNDYI